MILNTEPEAPHIHGPFVVGVTLVNAGVALEMDACAMTRILEIFRVTFFSHFHSPGSQDQFPFLT